MKPFSLKTKYICGICGLILFVSLALLLYLRSEFNKRLENELHKRSASIARKLAETSFKPIITEDYVALQLLINDLKQNEEDIRYIYIVTKQQQILAHTFGRAFPRDLLKFDQPDMKIGKPLVQTLQDDQELLEDVSVAIQRGDFGRVHIGISKEVLKTEQQEMIQRSAPFIGLILLIGSAAAWWFASNITRPIVALSDSAKMVAAGRLDGMIAVTSYDEIGTLTAAFNTMTSDLKKRTELQDQTESELRMQTSLLEDEAAERQMAQEELSVKNINWKPSTSRWRIASIVDWLSYA